LSSCLFSGIPFSSHPTTSTTTIITEPEIVKDDEVPATDIEEEEEETHEDEMKDIAQELSELSVTPPEARPPPITEKASADDGAETLIANDI
jgi:hypothetical protein